jgi:hypothetical protein
VLWQNLKRRRKVDSCHAIEITRYEISRECESQDSPSDEHMRWRIGPRLSTPYT